MRKVLNYSVLFVLALICFISVNAQKELTINTIPSDADLYKIEEGSEVKLAKGTYTIKLSRDKAVTIEARKDGFVTVRKTFLRSKEGQPIESIELNQRKVVINASPADANIYVNGADKGRSPVPVLIGKGESITLDIKKAGFVTQSKTLSNKSGQDVLDASYNFSLDDRIISLRTSPQDATIFVDDKKLKEGTAQVIIPKDKCVNVRVEKSGYVSNQVTYCNKESETIPPFNDEIQLKDRNVQINVTPEDAKIFVDNKEVGHGSVFVKVLQGQTKDVFVTKSSFVSERIQLCNQADCPSLDAVIPITLKNDEAYTASEENSNANKNFTIEVNPGITATDAWKKLCGIIYNYFDEIETADATTSYLKTNWIGVVFNKSSQFKSMIRTRVIVTGVSGNTLAYHIKIQSEISKVDSECVSGSDFKSSNGNKLTVSRDDCFEPLDRLLRKYASLINEVQQRLK